jgi:hypothetical protein
MSNEKMKSMEDEIYDNLQEYESKRFELIVNKLPMKEKDKKFNELFKDFCKNQKEILKKHNAI